MNRPTVDERLSILEFNGHRVQFTPTQAVMLAAYVRAMPAAVPTEEMISKVWRGARLPDDPENVLAAQRTYMRRALQRIGLALQNEHGIGHRLVIGASPHKPRKPLSPAMVARIIAQPNLRAADLARQLGISGPTVARYRRLNGQRTGD